MQVLFLFVTTFSPMLGGSQRRNGVKRSGREADRSSPSDAEVKNA